MPVLKEVGQSRRPHRLGDHDLRVAKALVGPVLAEIGDPNHRAYALDEKEILFLRSLDCLVKLMK